jgi:hypothetical protein
MRDAGGERRQRRQLLMLPGGPLEVAPLGDVSDEGHRQRPVRALDRAQTDLDRKLGAVVAPPEEI